MTIALDSRLDMTFDLAISAPYACQLLEPLLTHFNAPLELLHLATVLTVSLVVACTHHPRLAGSVYVHPRLKQPPSVIHGPLEVTFAVDSRLDMTFHLIRQCDVRTRATRTPPACFNAPLN